MAKHFMSFIIVITFIFALSACSVYQISSKDVATDYYEATNPAEIVYLETVDKPHTIIGYVTVNAERNQELDKVLRQIKKEAALLGGQIITNIRTNGGTGKWAQIKPKDFLGNAHVRANFIATVVVLK